ncbi:protein MAIN-LIKE 1-like [Arachis ipaensis]|uniref:protein MAIN-LIKE 1-like n=1 Tax=Arachis ipaensis TaxID=130454 RepID=UPI0007AF42DB|nr:protein MAIN-LIKE 1-like [Arachis ipaensis]XP_029148346.1 protein MAIN-LIKE 1-like [Arachis hypogaea]
MENDGGATVNLGRTRGNCVSVDWEIWGLNGELGSELWMSEGDANSCDFSDKNRQANRNLLPRKLNPSDTFNEVAAAALEFTGFQHVSRVGEMRGHSALLSALVERWQPETHTFHLPVGEVTVTLEDVAYILGLPINGEAVTGRSDSSHQFFVENCIACFGREPRSARSRVGEG